MAAFDSSRGKANGGFRPDCCLCPLVIRSWHARPEAAVARN
jgi:hypothetical protein